MCPLPLGMPETVDGPQGRSGPLAIRASGLPVLRAITRTSLFSPADARPAVVCAPCGVHWQWRKSPLNRGVNRVHTLPSWQGFFLLWCERIWPHLLDRGVAALFGIFSASFFWRGARGGYLAKTLLFKFNLIIFFIYVSWGVYII